MISYIKHDNINKTKWDHCIDNSFNSQIYAYSWYLDIVSPKWDALVDNDYISVMPLTHRRKYGISYICQPLICQQLGVFSTVHNETFFIDDFIDAIPQKFKLIDLAVNAKNSISEFPYKIMLTEKVNFELYLNKTYDNLISHFFKSHFINITKIPQDQIIIINGNKLLNDFYKYKLAEISIKEIRFTRYDQILYFNILNEFNSKNKLKISIAKNKENVVLGGICFILIKNRILFQSFSTRAGRKVSIGYYMINMIIKEHAGQDLILDFMGSDIKSIAYRNEGFGSTLTFYRHFKIDRLPNLFRYLLAVGCGYISIFG